MWFDPGYSRGVGATRTFAGDVCGVHQGRAVVSNERKVALVDVASGEKIRELPGSKCGELVGERYFYVRDLKETREMNVVSGEDRSLGDFTVPAQIFIGERDGLLYFHSDTLAGGGSIIAVGKPGEVVWRRDAPAQQVIVCDVLEGAIGCRLAAPGDVGADALLILDAASGAESRAVELPRPASGLKTMVRWYADGYQTSDVMSSGTPGSAPVYRLDGSPVEVSDKMVQDLFPNGHVVFAVADSFFDFSLTQSITQYVAADGTAVTVRNMDDTTSFVNGVRLADVPNYDAATVSDHVAAVARDGSSALVSDQKEMRIITADGREVAKMPSSVLTFVTNGIITVTTLSSNDPTTAKSSTTVFLPSGA